MKTIYDVDYFLAKFNAIPENKWLINYQGDVDTDGANPHCAIGWCKNYYNEYGNASTENSKEAYFLHKLFIDAGIGHKSDKLGWVIANINNGKHEKYKQKTSQDRILAALYDVKKFQQSQKSETIVIEKIKYVSVPESITKEVSFTTN